MSAMLSFMQTLIYKYKKLGLVGDECPFCSTEKYFETITEAEFNAIDDKKNLKMTSLRAIKNKELSSFIGGIET